MDTKRVIIIIYYATGAAHMVIYKRTLKS